MKKFLILTNSEKDPNMELTNRISDCLKKRGCECFIQTAVHKGRFEISEDIPSDCDSAIVLGGDGTMIQAADVIKGRKPIIGVNLGTLGFLQEVEASDIEEMVDRLTSDDFQIEKRMMLSGCKYDESKSENHIALNDIVITRKGSLKILYLNIYVNGQKLSNYKADGIVISTPTGSTAYNLSAGGPIVEPSAEAILITPICPHNLGARSIVLSPNDTIRVEVLSGRGEAEASFDGGAEIELSDGASIEISKAGIYTEIIKLGKESFVEVISRKMN